MGKSYGENDRLIHCTVGDTVAIELAANPTTGFEWQPIADRTFATVEEGAYRSSSKAIGSGGMQVFEVKPIKSGKTHVRFEYMQPWEGKPARTCEFEIDIRES